MNKNILTIAIGAVGLLSMASCSTKEFAIASGDESLTTLTKVTDNEEPCNNPYGGSNIVVVKNSEIWLKNLTTGETVLLGNGYQPSYSPDGKRIAYVKYSSDAESCAIWTMELDGSNPMQITDAKKGFAYEPCWSPDGTKLVFSSYKKDKKDYDLYVIDVDGNNLKQLTKNKSYDGQPYWTTDNYIYFVSDRGGKTGNQQIWRFKYND